MKNHFTYITLGLMLIFNGCIENNNPLLNNDIEYSSIQIGEVRDLFISDSTLFVGTESEGLYIYNINSNSNDLELMYSNIEWGIKKDIRSVFYDKNSQMIYALDRFDFIYEGYMPHVIDTTSNYFGDGDTLLKNECSLISTHATKFSVNNTADPELFILYKHNADNELYLDSSYSIIRHMQYALPPSMTFMDGFFISDCSNDALNIPDSLNYDINDMYFNENKFYLGTENSIDIYSLNGGLDSSLTVNLEVKSVYSINDFVLGGTDNGCYITLLSDDSNDIDNSNILSIAEGYTIYDIFYDQNLDKLILSAGAKGVLVYDWDGNSLDFNFNYRLLSSYAFTARIYNNMILVASKNGLEIFNIEE